MRNVNESINLDKSWKLISFCEFDKYAAKSYCAIHHVDENLNLGDITEVDERKLKPFNMICGGSPCQDFSVAGKQKGSVWTCKDCGSQYNPLTVHWSHRDKCPQCNSGNIEKTRSSLLVEYLRIVRATKPSFGIYENVKNIVGKQFRNTTFKLFEEELHEYGYNTYWKVLNSKDYGIPQNRERVYLIFIRQDVDNGQFKFPEPIDNSRRLKDMLEDEVDEKYYLSERAIKTLKLFFPSKGKDIKIAGTLNPDKKVQDRTRILDVNGISQSLRATDYKDPVKILYNQTEGNKLCQVGFINDYNGDANRVYSTDGCARTLKSEAGGGGAKTGWYMVQVPQATKQGYINCEIGGVADFAYPTSKSRRGRVQAGGAICPTITATPTRVCRIESPIRIRRLTPKECFRLMGFSDCDFDVAQESGISNSQLYKQAGNSIVVNVLYYIYVEIYKAMPYLFDDLKLGSFFSGIGAFEKGLDMLYDKYINQKS